MFSPEDLENFLQRWGGRNINYGCSLPSDSFASNSRYK